MAPHSRMVDSLLERALVVRVAFGAASESHLLAEVVSTFTADATLATGNTNLKRNPISDFEAADLRSNGNYLA